MPDLKDRITGRVSLLLRWLFPAVMLVFLIHNLSTIGWMQVWNARPRTVGFYLIQCLPYGVQPVSEWLIFRRLLDVSGQLPLSVLFRKRYLNSVLVEYSGETYFFFWAQKKLRLTRDNLLHVVRESALLSGGAGLAMVWVVVLIFLLSSGASLPLLTGSRHWMLLGASTLPLLPCLVLMVAGARLTRLTRQEMLWTFGIHFARSFVTLILEFASWWLSDALPSAFVCFEFVALRLIVTRLPLVPGKDILFVGLGLEAAGMMDLSRPKVAATLIIMAAFQQVMDFAVVSVSWLITHLRADRSATSHRP
ncbi:hypothetical protein [Acidomonas methanolica]|uniref:Uncharacterized protein n=1 Tax=Acidomonas methanolica NBRC 104435 TaxID=1231351 RepID=A0A023D878_ACIMT|nr:hypothetical protein [Acidomonas methanolica]TCS29436.1 hypothetical protein EDC31_1064 [Acidomonas methanolica]GAJ30299.1 hypothetical protein Amme_120_001 [Acidomonas methanolica NBRC 104435]GBQ47984.1 hypothetical protein AA0498_0663 [Acidomonas methanolica]GEL00782.1 hypothetical protein AME01nite_32800 [Acidomonas methanolica NBRC 104435]